MALQAPSRPIQEGEVEERARQQLIEEQAAQREEEELQRGGEHDSFEEDGIAQPFLYRLFVGWVPKHYDEKDLTPLFNQYGLVKDIIVLRDKVSGQKRGCAFISYATKDEAEEAIRHLDRQVQLPGALSLLEVRFAKSHQYVQAGSGPQDNRQLFFTSAPAQLNEPEISTFFSQFGIVEEVNLFRERKTGNSKGCGFITFQARDQAVQAMEALENKNAEPSKEMSVQWADPELQFKKKKALEESNADNRMLFFAKVLRSANEDDIKRLFSKYGKVYDVNLFRAFQGAPTTKGCGLVTMGTHDEARAAIEGLDGKYCCDGLDSPMVVKWMDAALQRRRREQHLAAMLQGLVPSMAAGPSDPWLPQHMALGGMPGLVRGGLPQALLLHEPEVGEAPPAGCLPDAIKLFVGNIPKGCTEDQLLPFFETLGKVAELVIVRDKATHQSKGSAFVWYVSRAHAERAILQFNLRHVLPDPSGEQDRPLVVRKARVRAGKPSMMQQQGLGGPRMSGAGPSQHNQQHPSVMKLAGPGGGGGNSGHILGLGGGGGQQYYASASPQHMQGNSRNGMGIGSNGHGASGLGPLEALTMQPMQGHAGGASYLPIASSAGGGYRTIQQLQGGAQLVSIQAAPTVSESGLYEAYGPGTGGDHMERYMFTTAQPMHQQSAALENMSPLAMSVPLSLQQLGLVNNHLFSVQSMSGAQLNISPGAPGLFHLLISGSKGQVESARGLVSQVLGQVLMG